MEEEKMLKQKYNDLLESLYKGTEYLKEKPNDEKAQKRLDEIAIEMQNIMQALPNMTDEEKEKGFVVSESNKEVVEIKGEIQSNVKNTEIQIKQKKEPVLQNFNQDWEIASQLAKSSIIPDNYKGKPENVIIAVRISKTNEFTTIYSYAKSCNYKTEKQVGAEVFVKL